MEQLNINKLLNRENSEQILIDFLHTFEKNKHIDSTKRGIYLYGGTTGWTINNNKFYDAMLRVGTIGRKAYHYSIDIQDGDGYTIDDNQFGGNDADLSGNWTYDALGNTVFLT